MSLFDYKARTLNGEEKPLSDYKGKVLLVVNTASKCGFTPQYEGLQKLYANFADRGLEVLGFPCNQFGKQEPGTNAEIKAFVEDKFDFSGEGVYLMDKIDVNGPNTHPLWEFLKAKYPGDVSWNFAAKFLVDKNGEVVERNGLGAGESKAKLVAML